MCVQTVDRILIYYDTEDAVVFAISTTHVIEIAAKPTILSRFSGRLIVRFIAIAHNFHKNW